jgi:hypothetical protein
MEKLSKKERSDRAFYYREFRQLERLDEWHEAKPQPGRDYPITEAAMVQASVGGLTDKQRTDMVYAVCREAIYGNRMTYQEAIEMIALLMGVD